MTPEQFKNLKEGDVIRNEPLGVGYHVLHATGGEGVLIQRVTSLYASRAEEWSLVSGLTPAKPKTENFPPAPKRLPRIIMHRRVLDAQGVAVESKEGTTYRIRGRVFDTLEAAWDALPKVKFEGGKTLFQRRLDLRKVGWTMDDSSGGVVWTSPHSGRRIPGTRAAWDYVFGDDAP